MKLPPVVKVSSQRGTPSLGDVGINSVTLEVSDGTYIGNHTFDIEVIGDTDLDGVPNIDDIYPNDLSSNGDTNGDGAIDTSDALLALQVAVGRQVGNSVNLKFADVAPLINGRPVPDGKITAADALVILRKVVGLVVDW